MTSPNYSNFSKNLQKDDSQLDSIFRKLKKDREDKNTLKKFEQILKSKIDIKNLLPCSKSFQGENIMTLSKFWMILILLKITKGKIQQEDFLTLVNSSLTHDLNEYEEYRQFFEDQCEQMFSDEEAITIINSNPRAEKKLTKPSEHEEIRDNYIYLLYRPDYFNKVNKGDLPKIKKKEQSKKKSKSKSKSRTNNKTKSELESEEDEKGDRLDERDMISKLKINTNKKNTSIRKKEKESSMRSITKSANGNKRGRGRPKQKKEESEEKVSDEETSKNKKDKKSPYKERTNKKNKKESEDEITDEERKPIRKIKGKKNKEKNINNIYDLLGLSKKDEESKNKNRKKSVSIPHKKTDSEKETTKELKNAKKSKSEFKVKKDVKVHEKEKKVKRGRKRRQKEEEESSEEEEEEFTSNLSQLSEFKSNKYDDDLDQFDDDEKRQMEKEIKAALEGKMEDLDIENILEGSKVEGFSLNNLSSSNEMDLDEEYK